MAKVVTMTARDLQSGVEMATNAVEALEARAKEDNLMELAEAAWSTAT